jgi:hypothetical protein
MNKQTGGSKLSALMIVIVVVGVVGFIAYGLLVAWGPRM